jgi:hypothetical protein
MFSFRKAAQKQFLCEAAPAFRSEIEFGGVGESKARVLFYSARGLT